MNQKDNKENLDPFNFDEVSKSIKNVQKSQKIQNKEDNTTDTYKCPDCKQIVELSQLQDHKGVCQILCEYCKENYPSYLIKEHYTFCEQKQKFKLIKIEVDNGVTIEYPDIFDIVLIHDEYKFWNIQFTAFKTRIICGKIDENNAKLHDDTQCVREHASIQELKEYIQKKINQKLSRGYKIEILEPELSEKGQVEDESDISFTEDIEQFDIKQSTTLRQFKSTNAVLKDPTDGIKTFQGDHKIQVDSSEWALLIGLYRLLVEQGKEREFFTKYEIRDQLEILNYSFEIKIKKDPVYLFLRTEMKYIQSQTEGDQEYFSLTEIGKQVGKTLYDQKMLELEILEEQFKQNTNQKNNQQNKEQQKNQQQISDEEFAKKMQEEEDNLYNDEYQNKEEKQQFKSPNILKNDSDYKIKFHSSDKQKQQLNQIQKQKKSQYEIVINDTNIKGKLLSTQEIERKKQMLHSSLFVAPPDKFVYDQNSELSIRDLTDLSMGPSRNVSQQNSLNNSQISQYGVLGRNSSKPYNVLLAEKWEDTKYDPKNYMMSEKMDGVRGVWTGKQLYSRNQKRFFPPKFFTENWPNCMLDGELWTARDDFSTCVSYVKKKSPIDSEWRQVKYIVYDCPGLDKPFKERIKILSEEIQKLENPYIVCHPHIMCRGQQHLDQNLKDVLEQGGEGLMMREINSMYVNKRSKTLLKVKVFQDEEAVVIGHLPGEGRNAYVTGSLQCRNGNGVVFKVGSGLNDDLRRKPPKIGSKITYKFQGLSKNGKPRFPTFLRICPQM